MSLLNTRSTYKTAANSKESDLQLFVKYVSQIHESNSGVWDPCMLTSWAIIIRPNVYYKYCCSRGSGRKSEIPIWFSESLQSYIKMRNY